MKLKLALDDKLMDVRLRDRLVSEGKIKKSDVDTYLGGLEEESSSNYERLGGEEESSTTTTEQ